MTIELYIKRENLWYYVADKVSEPLNPLKHGYHASNLGIIRQMVKNYIYSPNFKDPSLFMPKVATKLCSCRSDYAGCWPCFLFSTTCGFK